MGYLDTTDVELRDLTRERRRERLLKVSMADCPDDVDILLAYRRLHGPGRFPPAPTVYYGGSQSVIKFKTSRPDPVFKARRDKRLADKAEAAHKYVRIFILQDGRCYLCGKEIETLDSATDDHVVPKKLGGRRLGNILHAHAPCNHAKGHREPRPCELLYLQAILHRLPRRDLKRAGRGYIELPAYVPLRERLKAA